jgi:hypothetical protein
LSFNGVCDAYLAKLNGSGTALDYCGYVGGSEGDYGWGIDVDHSGNVHIVGETGSKESSFPVKNGPDPTHNGGLRDGFVAMVQEGGQDLEYCGYVGGNGEEWCIAIALDPLGHVHITGATNSKEASFPVVKGPDLTHNGLFDVFLARLSQGLHVDVHTLSAATGGKVHFSLDASLDNAFRNYFLLGSISGTEPGIPLPGGMATLPLNWDFFLMLVINMINGPIFQDFAGVLDSSGKGTASFNLPAGTGATGLSMYYAYALNKPYDFVSNPVMIQIVP